MSDKISDKYRITLTEKQFELIWHAVDVMLVIAAISGKNKSADELEYETIYSAIRNFKVPRDTNANGSNCLVQSGKEPVPEIERID